MMGSANEKWAANGKAARQGRGSHALRLPSRGERGSLTRVLLVNFKMEFGTLDTDKIKINVSSSHFYSYEQFMFNQALGGVESVGEVS